MPVEVVPYSSDWPARFEQVATDLRAALADVRSSAVEHVGSTSVPGLAAKPIIDIDVVVDGEQLPAAIAAVQALGYTHQGDLGVSGREAFQAPDEDLRRHVYVCRRGTLGVRNHLAAREVLRSRADLRDAYGAVKTTLASNPELRIETYIAGKSAVLQRVLAASNLTHEERQQILRFNDPTG